MADVTIHDLSARSGAIAASDQFEVDDGNSSTDTEKVTFAQLGGLAYSASSVTTGNVTATVGTLHALDLSGLTADRNFVLPDSAQVGERIGVFIATGDDTYELDIVTAATGSLINGSNAGGGTSWSRLFITNECCVFRCINAGGAGDTDWIVEYDGRIPCEVTIGVTTDDTTASADSTWDVIDLSAFCAVDVDNGSMVDTTNDEINIRRSGSYWVQAQVRPRQAQNSSGATAREMGTAVRIQTGTDWQCLARTNHQITSDNTRHTSKRVNLSVGDQLEWLYLVGTAADGLDGTDFYSFFSLVEVL